MQDDAASDGQTYGELLLRGNDLLARREFELAVMTYGQAITKRPHEVEAWLHRSIARRQLQDWSGSESDAVQALHLNPDNEQVLQASCGRAICLQKLGRQTEAIVACGDGLERFPNSEPLLKFRSELIKQRCADASLCSTSCESPGSSGTSNLPRASGNEGTNNLPRASGNEDLPVGVAVTRSLTPPEASSVPHEIVESPVKHRRGSDDQPLATKLKCQDRRQEPHRRVLRAPRRRSSMASTKEGPALHAKWAGRSRFAKQAMRIWRLTAKSASATTVVASSGGKGDRVSEAGTSATTSVAGALTDSVVETSTNATPPESTRELTPLGDDRSSHKSGDCKRDVALSATACARGGVGVNDAKNGGAYVVTSLVGLQWPVASQAKQPQPRREAEAVARVEAEVQPSPPSPSWRRFTPAVIDPNGCQARTWSGGRGGQCKMGRDRHADSEFCHKHGLEEKWRVHGRLDGPIPLKKLGEFLKAAIFDASKACDEAGEITMELAPYRPHQSLPSSGARAKASKKKRLLAPSKKAASKGVSKAKSKAASKATAKSVTEKKAKVTQKAQARSEKKGASKPIATARGKPVTTASAKAKSQLRRWSTRFVKIKPRTTTESEAREASPVRRRKAVPSPASADVEAEANVALATPALAAEAAAPDVQGGTPARSRRSRAPRKQPQSPAKSSADSSLLGSYVVVNRPRGLGEYVAVITKVDEKRFGVVPRSGDEEREKERLVLRSWCTILRKAGAHGLPRVRQGLTPRPGTVAT
eukprot:TRINITY_DN21865_c0_g1_i3.p1 TRINITY_DN21865_c0_g1~~TRINITY_DN21865_c0_g1_i3.p1  ORF type:complete len:813 (-),score=124.11 TRINITY_DN21865_c0_g1_i3:123-2408(-)